MSVAGGKGGTGKTLLATSLALVGKAWQTGAVTLVDCDVEAPNAHLLLRPEWLSHQTVTVSVPRVDACLCAGCGKCAEACQTSAIAVIRGVVVTFPGLCSGCGACSYVCPLGAIVEEPHGVGTVSCGTSPEGVRVVSGRLRVGYARSPVVIDAARSHVVTGALTVVDAPPGTACPMQRAVEATDFCVMVTEPTPFGCSDLALAIETCRELEVPCGVVVNRDGIGSARVEDVCERYGVPILLRIPHSREIAAAYADGRCLVSTFPEWRGPLDGLLDEIERQVSAARACAH